MRRKTINKPWLIFKSVLMVCKPLTLIWLSFLTPMLAGLNFSSLVSAWYGFPYIITATVICMASVVTSTVYILKWWQK